LAAILEPGFDRHREAVIIGPADGALATAPATAHRAARISVDEPEQVAVGVQVERPSLLVLADAFAPGWEVRVDGTPRPLLQVNYFVRGVVVRPGEGRAEFSYRAPGLGVGLAAAACVWGGVLLGAALGYTRKGRQVLHRFRRRH
jgi:hypothetical protein